ncbi:MAG: L,D-transpeptidase, partial [Pyrinomonadaceae bacterium]
MSMFVSRGKIFAAAALAFAVSANAGALPTTGAVTRTSDGARRANASRIESGGVVPAGGPQRQEKISAAGERVSSGERVPSRATTSTDAMHESARSDKFTGGRIERAALEEGEPNVEITINVPAFRLTLWQNGREVKTYPVGVGMKDFPIIIGPREATQIIWNPSWFPPDSKWVREMPGVRPGENIKASDPRNPLGKLKIPLGHSYLIHQAAKTSDLGNLVSHGCIRMLRSDLYDLTDKIMAARSWPVPRKQVERAKRSSRTVVADLDEPLLVDINYDTHVVE